MQKEIIYYDELNDEFSSAKITPKTIGDEYDYDGGVKRKIGRVFFYHILAKPLAFLYLKIGFGHKIEGLEKLKCVRGQGYFLYGNHTNPGPDALIPTMINFLGSTYVIVHPNNVSMPVMGKITPSLGALPLPDTMKAMKNFNKIISEKIKKGCCVMIYPEAHIWPYYTKIRPFTKQSFGYPVQENAPVFCLTNVYRKRCAFFKPRMVTYIDGPFYADKTLTRNEQKQCLRDRVYDTMVMRSEMNNVEYIKYVRGNVE